MDMKTWLPKMGLFGIIMGFSLAGWASKACLPIAKACMHMGYYKGGNKEGKGLIMNCVLPTAQNDKSMAKMPFTPAEREACAKSLKHKMKGHLAN